MSDDARPMAHVIAAREAGDPGRIVDAIPYARFLGLRASLRGEELLLCMPASERVIGNPVLPALHGGTVGALLESAAILQLLWQGQTSSVPKIITLTIDYLRSARLVDTFAQASITRLGRRVANVQVRAFQDDPSRPIAGGHAHFLLRGGAAE